MGGNRWGVHVARDAGVFVARGQNEKRVPPRNLDEKGNTCCFLMAPFRVRRSGCCRIPIIHAILKKAEFGTGSDVGSSNLNERSRLVLGG